ncbi:hypothetical protein TFKS16_1675 [Tannerella forsythia KS16]|nr:hypothetical protein TF3313_1736 [Tannerella forsythia 3313]BAR51916.1 hypothetical protein TFKS16_1675 [Tannerella forsythia KS16]
MLKKIISPTFIRGNDLFYRYGKIKMALFY